MKTNSEAIPTNSDRTLRIERLLEDVIRRRSTGNPFDDHRIIEENPELMPELAEHLCQLSMVEEAERCAQSDASSGNGLSDRSEVHDGHSTSMRSDSIPGCTILEEIYRGGQGVVYRARHRATGRDVAIKVLRDGPFQGPHDRVRFDREVRVLAQLKHPNIVTIHDSGTASGSHYFVMDYIEGQPLDAFMASKKKSVKVTLGLFQKICSAVNAAHVRGIIHRDLKPGNIRIDEHGEPHILDFGLAKIVTAENEGSTDQQTMTLTGQFVGSLHWASPEQAQGVPDRIDLRTDVYSLGLILYHMLTGQFPYVVTGNTQSVLRNIIETEPTRPGSIRTDIDDEINTIVLKCLAKESEFRYQTAGAVADDVER